MKNKIEPRYSKIANLIWCDDKFPFAPDDVQLLWFHLQTNDQVNSLGLYKANLEGLAAEKNKNKKWLFKRYEKAFEDGLDLGFWLYDALQHVIYFPKFLRFNRPANPNVLQFWGKQYDEVPNCKLKAQFFATLRDLIKDEYGEGYQAAFKKSFREPTMNGAPLPVPAPRKPAKKKKEPEKKEYGEFKNVLLTDEQREKLDTKFGKSGAKTWIEKASSYLESKGKKKSYSSHYAMIVSWALRDKKGGGDDRFDGATK